VTTPIDEEGFHIEVIGQCMTNPRKGSQHTQTVEARYLWSYAQEEALTALSEQGEDRCWRLITDPERRAKRIAARYADLYFASAEKSKGKLQFLWPALAAFVVKDIVEAYRYTRDDVLSGGWRNVLRTSDASKIASQAWSEASPYEHAMRVYAALAKGNLWLFMDIFPWYWYVLEYGLNKDGSFNASRMQAHVGERDGGQFQEQSREAVKELPFGSRWMERMKVRLAGDPVYAEARNHFATTPTWGGVAAGYGQHLASAQQAHRHVRQHAKTWDGGYRLPASARWSMFDEAFYVMEEERKELSRIAADGAAVGRLQKVAQFKASAEIRNAYALFTEEHAATEKMVRLERQRREVPIIAKQEQLNVLQPLIYEDRKLMRTMDVNHLISRASLGTLSPTYTVYFSATPKNDDPELQVTFDAAKGPWDYVTGPKASLPNPKDRMVYVGDIAKQFNFLMQEQRAYMDKELQKIRGWLHA
jgi:hypothetical protein